MIDGVADALQKSADEMGWDEYVQAIHLVGFIEMLAEGDPLIYERFQGYLDQVVEEQRAGDAEAAEGLARDE